MKINKIYNNNNFWPINRINHSEKRTCELYFNRIEWPIQLSDYYRIETRLFLESSSIIHRQHSPILSEIFIEIRLDLLYDDIIYTRRVSTFPTKKLIVILTDPHVLESKIYYKYPDSRRIVTFRTTRILEIKIVSLAAINLTKQSKKKPNSSPHLNRMCANNRSGSFVLRGPVSEVAE